MNIISVIWDVIQALVIVGIIIFIHELGHFLAAKRTGIKVERFSMGFGPKLWGFKRGDTEYRISWLLIVGGYVKMAGENPTEEQKEEKGQFFSAPVWRRAVIAASGPGMNIVFAVFFIALAFMVGLPSKLGTEIGYVEPNSPAAKAGIKPGDKILSAGGYSTRKWDDIRETISINPNKEIEITLLRNGSETIIYVVPELIEGTEFGKIGVSPIMYPIIGEVAPNSKAEQAGFRPGDIIQAVNGKRVSHVIEVADLVENNKQKKVVMTVNRDGSLIEIPFALDLDESGVVKSFSGVSFGKLVRLNPIAAFGSAVTETFQTTHSIFKFLKRLINRDVPAKYISGPVGIVQITMLVVKTGIAGILWFAGFLSINLGIINLLPLFITDGGVLVFLLIEALRGKPMSIKKQIFVQQVGLGFIVLLFLLVTYNDVLRLFRGGF